MIAILFASILVATVHGQAAPQQSEVAFSAGIDHNQLLQHAEKVVYDKVFANIGNGYNVATGIFTCPMSGVYVFNFHFLARLGMSSWLELYKNANYIASAYGHADGNYASAGNSVILTLTQGDTVYVKAVDNSYGYDTNLYGASDEIYGTFTGYLISKIDQVIPPAGK